MLNPKEILADNDLRAKRVEQLRLLYEEKEPLEISPFDDGSADLANFLFDGLWDEV